MRWMHKRRHKERQLWATNPLGSYYTRPYKFRKSFCREAITGIIYISPLWTKLGLERIQQCRHGFLSNLISLIHGWPEKKTIIDQSRLKDVDLYAMFSTRYLQLESLMHLTGPDSRISGDHRLTESNTEVRPFIRFWPRLPTCHSFDLCRTSTDRHIGKAKSGQDVDSFPIADRFCLIQNTSGKLKLLLSTSSSWRSEDGSNSHQTCEEKIAPWYCEMLTYHKVCRIRAAAIARGKAKKRL